MHVNQSFCDVLEQGTLKFFPNYLEATAVCKTLSGKCLVLKSRFTKTSCPILQCLIPDATETASTESH
jgi:hypothetical protein